MDFEKKLGRISSRDWHAVSSAWLRFLPAIEPPGTPPEDGVADHVALGAAVKATPTTGEHRWQGAGVRESLFREAVFLLHKARHVVGCGEILANGGRLSWSLSTAYQGAFFAMEGVLGLLGVSIVQVENRWVIVDVWPEVRDGASKRERTTYELGSDIVLISAPNPDHYHRWAILQRVLRTLSNPPILTEVIDGLDSPAYKDFARQRNTLHYRCKWLLEDLFELLTIDGFGQPSTKEDLLEIVASQKDDFSLVLSMLLLNLGSRLLGDLAASAPMVDAELRLLQTPLANPARHPLYASFAPLLA